MSESNPPTDLPEKPETKHLPRWMYRLTIYYIVLMIFSIWGLIQTVFAPLEGASVRIPLLWLSENQVPPMSLESHVMLISALAGAHGGLVLGLARLAAAAKDGDYDPRYIIWHLQRPFIGAGMAVALYFIFRSGILTNVAASALNVYAVAAAGVVTGIAESAAIDKMREVFRTIFSIKAEDEKTTSTTEEINKNNSSS